MTDLFEKNLTLEQLDAVSGGMKRCKCSERAYDRSSQQNNQGNGQNGAANQAKNVGTPTHGRIGENTVQTMMLNYDGGGARI